MALKMHLVTTNSQHFRRSAAPSCRPMCS